jgi:hypothetical protein
MPDQYIVKLQDAISKRGIIHPIYTAEIAADIGADLPSCCAMLMMETSGGRNEFGHDPGNAVQGGDVTEARYKELRASVERGTPSQGVGPCQLTSVGLLDEADKLDGAWDIVSNMIIGFDFLHHLQESYGSLQLGFYHYNGSGNAAEVYSYRAMSLQKEFAAAIAELI